MLPYVLAKILKRERSKAQHMKEVLRQRIKGDGRGRRMSRGKEVDLLV